MNTNMNLPIRALYTIRQFSKPIGTRVDWKSCKRNEARCIKMRKRLLPDDVLNLIKEYSMPIGTRLDWRTCKRNESRRIKMSNRALTLWYRWLIGPGERALFNEINDWTFYGRRHLILESRQRLWTQMQLNDDEWYEKKFMVLVHHEGWPYFMTADYVEVHMHRVSLIV